MTSRVLLRGFAGALTAGLAVLLVVLIGSWVAAFASGTRGPGGLMLGGHLAAVVLAVVLQRVADRRGDRVGSAAAAGVVMVTAAVIIIFWWS